MRDLKREFAGAAVVAAAAVLLCPLDAWSAMPMRQTPQLVFTSKRPGSPTGTNWVLRFRDPAHPNGKPPSLQSSIAAFPPGTKIDTSAPAQCHASDADLTLAGTAACSAQSRVATGRLDVDTGSLAVFPRVLHNNVTNFNNAGQSIIFTETTNMPGTQTRTVSRGRIEGRTITTDVPPIPGVPPPDPYTALKLFQLNVPRLTRGPRSYVTTPSKCPRSRRWTFTLTFIYRDGVRQVVKSHTPCRTRTRRRPRERGED